MCIYVWGITDTADLHNAIKVMYDDQLSNAEVFEAGANLIGFFELLVSIDKRDKSQAEGTENEQNYECLYRPDTK